MSEAKVKKSEAKESGQQQQEQQRQDSTPLPEPNIRLSADRAKEDVPWAGSVTIGNSDPIVLPEEAVQVEGWHEPRAMELVRLSGGLYKMISKKGVR